MHNTDPTLPLIIIIDIRLGMVILLFRILLCIIINGHMHYTKLYNNNAQTSEEVVYYIK